MDNPQTMFWVFILIAIALAFYGIVVGRWLIRKSLQLADEVKGDFRRGLKALAMWPISIVALIIIPMLVVSSSDHFSISLDRRNLVLMISLIPSCLYNIYYRCKIGREYEKRG